MSITVILLNYRRPHNVPRIVCALRAQTVVPMIWLWNNAGARLETPGIDFEVTAAANLGCWPRWFLATYARTEYVMMIDDDIVPNSERMLELALAALAVEAMPRTIVGAEGVVLGSAGSTYWPSYHGRIARSSADGVDGSVHLKKVDADVRVDIVKGRCLALRTDAVRDLPLAPSHRDMCDDIAVSSLLAAGRSRPHLVSAALGRALDDIPDADAEVALSKRPDWREVREAARAHYHGVEPADGSR